MIKSLFYNIFRFFASIRLAIILLILIACTSIIGTVILQNATPDQYKALYSIKTYKVMNSLGLFDFYRSIWFVLLLIMLSLNLLFCSIKRLPSVIRLISKYNIIKEEDALKNMSQFWYHKGDMEFKKLITKIEKSLTKTFSKPKSISKKESYFFYADKGKYNSLGAYVTHFSIITILIGALLGSIFGFRGNMNIPEGKAKDTVFLRGSFTPKKLDFKVRCDNFNVTYYPNGSPKEYKSILTILKDGKELFTKDIRVNHPLKYEGFYFYQSSFGTVNNECTLVFLVSSKKDNFEKTYEVKEREKFVITEKNIEVYINKFIPDFVMDENKKVISRSKEPNNPAVHITIKEKGVNKGNQWLFSKFPDFHETGTGDLKYQLVDIKLKNFTGLQVTKDPGLWVVWSGCTFLVLGMILAFYYPHRRIWVKVEKGDKKNHVFIGGTSNRNPWDFKREFLNVINNIKKEL